MMTKHFQSQKFSERIRKSIFMLEIMIMQSGIDDMDQIVDGEMKQIAC